MEVSRGDTVLLDTNVIIEAHRVSCWKALASCFELKTVSLCVQEATDTRFSHRKGYVDVPEESLRGRIETCDVTQPEVADLLAKAPGVYDLDDGERDLLAHAIVRPDLWVLASPDHAVVQALKTLNVLNRYVSLEELLQAGKIQPARDLKKNHLRGWLAQSLLR